MADWSLPTLTSTYANFLSNLTARDTDAATQFSVGTPTNTPTGAIKWDTALNRWQKWSGTAWGELATTYALTGITCTSFNNTGNTTLGDSSADTVTVNASTVSFPNGVTFSGAVAFGTAIPVASGGTGATTAAGARTNLDVPTTGGSGATGTWGISISGTAATATTANALNTSNSYQGVNFTGARFIGGNGSASSPTFSFSSDGAVDTGFYWGGDGLIYVTCNGVYRGGWDASGNFTSTGEITAYSDERLKKNWRNVDENIIEQVAGLKAGIYDRIDTGETQVGVGAQSLQAILPEAVSEDHDGTLKVAYGNAAMLLVVELAKEVQALKAELAALKGV